MIQLIISVILGIAYFTLLGYNYGKNRQKVVSLKKFFKQVDAYIKEQESMGKPAEQISTIKAACYWCEKFAVNSVIVFDENEKHHSCRNLKVCFKDGRIRCENCNGVI